jgi:putative nucleotidyltransferase with HDIG domain
LEVDDIARALPEVDLISDRGLRGLVLEAWRVALDRSPFDSLGAVPFTLLIEDLDDTLVDHTRRVTRMAEAVARARGDVNLDTVVAGALLHDVGKLLECEPGPGGRVVKSEMGRQLRHPVSGAAIAMELGLPLAVVHVIAAHAGEGDMVSRTPEAITVHHVDMVDFDIARVRLGRGAPAPRPGA